MQDWQEPSRAPPGGGDRPSRARAAWRLRPARAGNPFRGRSCTASFSALEIRQGGGRGFIDRRAGRGRHEGTPFCLEADDDLATRLIRLHEAMRVAYLGEPEDARGLCLVDS